MCGACLLFVLFDARSEQALPIEPTPLPSLHSEYASECFNRRAFVSGFTGSAGTAVILKDEVSF